MTIGCTWTKIIPLSNNEKQGFGDKYYSFSVTCSSQYSGLLKYPAVYFITLYHTLHILTPHNTLTEELIPSMAD